MSHIQNGVYVPRVDKMKFPVKRNDKFGNEIISGGISTKTKYREKLDD